MNHSPLPWKVEEQQVGNAAPCYRIKHASAMAKEYQVAELYGEICFNAKDDAKFIALAANNFEALLEACERIERWLAFELRDAAPVWATNLKVLRAAIAAATPEPDTDSEPPADTPSAPQ